jgi:hypothetical protein
MSGASSLLLSLSVLPLDLFNLFCSVCNSGRRDNTFRLLDLEVDEFVIAFVAAYVRTPLALIAGEKRLDVVETCLDCLISLWMFIWGYVR